jgi:hypothetical protein
MGKYLRAWAILFVLATSLLAPPVMAQNKGAEKAHKQAEHKAGKQQNDKAVKMVRDKPAKADKADHKDKDDYAVKKHTDGDKTKHRFKRNISAYDLQPKFRVFALSKRAPERIAAGALAHGIARGLRDDDVVITRSGERVRLLNRSGVLLIDLDEQRARNLGGWRVWPDDRDVRADGPSFCRSGAGHPVWGRQWCIDKGFGLGSLNGLRWGIARNIDDIEFRRVDSSILTRAVLLDVLGDVVFDRLGLHAITLGATDPLAGVWLGEATGPRVLRITAGETPIAEIVDANRDNRAELLVVTLRPW